MKSFLTSQQLVFGSIGMLSSGMALAQNAKPNVILIYTDDQGALDANCYGASDLYTPNIDALANEGVRFTQFYAAPVSSISRACLMSGQFSKRAGVVTNVIGNAGLRPEKETIAERLKANGYRTALIGKWHLGETMEIGPNAQGFDYFYGFRGGLIDSYSHLGGDTHHDLWRNEQHIYSFGNFFTDENIKEIKRFIQEDKNQPFFVYWASNIPHYPLLPHEKWIEYYAQLPIPRKMYAAYISTLDEYIGQLRTFLKSEGLDKNTIIIFQSDNGHSLETRSYGQGGYCGNLRGAKDSLFEGGIRVPAIISWPGILPEGEVRNQVAMNIDWFPTIVDLCQLSVEGMEVDGKSLVPILNDASLKSPHDVLHFDFWTRWALRCGDWKLLKDPMDVKPNGKSTEIKGLFLVNLKNDSTESVNVIEQYPEKVKELLNLRKEYELSLLEKNK